ncbi:related to scytalone dehydratase [Ramularia collo-cygni]|uniref:Related to scytalone dehydratase n=1 Tax=Ramularia collo-cygni TaxID=112498 RepID=A0A2D3UWT6_9PEZI|nr:related to scytalone dehydratase [Ramularia collo-cygni]CZT17610.1 related to scytalone dehydratase [Ramularia collo-cygni]
MHPHHEDTLAMQALAFDWAHSYDTKDWGLLASILSHELDVDYSQVTGSKCKTMTKDDFVAMLSDKTLLGNDLVSTHHLIGASKYEMLTESSAIGVHQIRAAHQRYTQSDKKAVAAKGHGHGLMQHKYLKTPQGWRIAGIRPIVYWNEYDFDKIFV